MSRPLRVLLTRDEGFADEVRALGAEVTVAAVTRVEAIPAEIDPAGFDWIVFTSRRAVAYCPFPLDGGPRIACVGPTTCLAVIDRRGVVSVVPERHDAASLVESMARLPGIEGATVLFPCAEGAPTTVEDGLSRVGARVTRLVLYRTLRAEAIPAGAKGNADVVVFLAPSAVNAYEALGGDLGAIPALAIGRTTAAALRGRGVEPVVAPTADRSGVLEALGSWRIPE